MKLASCSNRVLFRMAMPPETALSVYQLTAHASFFTMQYHELAAMPMAWIGSDFEQR